MAAAKKSILVINDDWGEREEFPTIAKAEEYINDAISNGACIDNLTAYEITKEFCLEETTIVKIADGC